MAALLFVLNSILSSGIFYSPPLAKFHDPASLVSFTNETQLRLGQACLKAKLFAFTNLVRPPRFEPRSRICFC